ncbi:MAG: hypothetical protein LBN08_00885 [Lactobacillales bacterium]|jgi:hypothetical protein|nr:hypothetical protein [Lactobacillales bacterium]
MDKILIDIILATVAEKYDDAADFYKVQLGLDDHTWQLFKDGVIPLPQEVMPKVLHLFSDYEWMLIQKVIRNASIHPESRETAPGDYRRAKIEIANVWLKANIAELDIAEHEPHAAFINARVLTSYGDLITFRIPASVSNTINGDQHKLLEWANKNLV